MSWLKTKTLVGLTATVALLVMAAFLAPALSEIVQNANVTASGQATSTTATCTFPRDDVNQEDMIIVAIDGTTSLSTIADSSSNSYHLITSADLTGGTYSAYSYLYVANATTVPARGSTLTITATFGTTGYGSVYCLDTIAVNPHAAHTSTGTGTGAGSYVTSVGSYSPTAGDTEISSYAGMSCGSDSGSVPMTSGYTKYLEVTSGATSSTCYTGYDYTMTSGAAYYTAVPAGARTDEIDVDASASGYSGGTLDWAEVAADFELNTVITTSVGVTASMTAHHTHAATTLTETEQLGVQKLSPTVTQTETVTEGIGGGQPQYSKVFLICEGVSATVTGGSSYNSGPVCNYVGSTTVMVATQACTFFQLQCWWFPMMFMGMYSAFIWVPVAVRKGSEKAVIYSFLAGATIASWVEVLLGVMTPALPVLLIAGNIVYSFNLIGRVTQRFAGT